jgi:hypothetical protein
VRWSEIYGETVGFGFNFHAYTTFLSYKQKKVPYGVTMLYYCAYPSFYLSKELPEFYEISDAVLMFVLKYFPLWNLQ